MSSQDLSGLLLATTVALVVLVGLVFVVRSFRARLFPPKGEARRDEARAELIRLKARLEQQARKGDDQGGEDS